MARVTSATFRLRCAALLVVITATALTAIATAPAAGASPHATRPPAAASSRALHATAALAAADPYEECLTNANTVCLGVSPGEVIQYGSEIISIIVGGTAIVVYVVKKWLKWWNSGPGTHRKNLWAGYFEDGGTSNGQPANSNLCLTDGFAYSGEQTYQVVWEPCGSNGTVWIEAQDYNGGNLNISQYSVDNYGCVINYPAYESSAGCDAMSAYSPFSKDYPVQIDYPVSPGGSVWQDWNP
jgi:hypothetical protein